MGDHVFDENLSQVAKYLFWPSPKHISSFHSKTCQGILTKKNQPVSVPEKLAQLPQFLEFLRQLFFVAAVWPMYGSKNSNFFYT